MPPPSGTSKKSREHEIKLTIFAATGGIGRQLLEQAVLRDSGLDWTVVRPPRLTDKPLTGTYGTAYGQNLRRGFFVSSADLAQLMLRALEQPETIKQAIGIAN